HDFHNFNEVIDKVKEIDNNDDMYDKIIAEPPFINNTIPDHLKKENLVKFLRNIFDNDNYEAIQRPAYGTTIKYENDLKNLYLTSSRYDRLQPYFKYLKMFKK